MSGLGIQYLPGIPDVDLDFESPIAGVALLQKIDDSLRLLQGMIEDKTSLILEGLVDLDPPNVSPSFITDLDPTSGEIDRDDKFNGLRIEMIDGLAAGDEFDITDTVAGPGTLHTLEDIFLAGVRQGDSYVVHGHDHNGLNSANIDSDDVIGITVGNLIPVEGIIFINGPTCPTGWTFVGTGLANSRLLVGTTSASGGAIGTIGDHLHGNNPVDVGRIIPTGITRFTSIVAGSFDLTITQVFGSGVITEHSHIGNGALGIGDLNNISAKTLRPCFNAG